MDIIILYSFVCVVSWPTFIEATVSISPTHAHIQLAPSTVGNVRVTCDAAANITQCEFKVGEHAPIDPRLGTNGEQTAGYVFEGDLGRCQVTLPWTTFTLDGTFEVVGCRVRDQDTDWSYATMTVYSSKHRALALALAPQQETVAPGEAVSVLASTSTALDSCSTLRDNLWLTLNDVARCEERVCYHGAGLEGGECGVTVNNVTDEDNGRLWLRVKSRDFAEGLRLVHVVVAKRPKYVTLDYSVTADKGGTLTLKAWCSVIGGRPTPNVTWYLSGVEITEGVVSVPDEKWAWPEDEKTINQSLTRTFSEVDGGKELRCTASFVAEGNTLSVAKLLDYQDRLQTDEGYGVLACVLFGLTIILYLVVVSLTDFTVFAWRRQLFCFKRLSYESGASLDTDVMDYHATMPPRGVGVTREDSYVEPIQHAVPGQRHHARDSYFLPTTPESKRVSTKAERTLGLDHIGRAPKPTPRHSLTPSKKKQKHKTSTLNKSEQKSLFMPTPVEHLLEVEQQGGASRYKKSDEVPIYINIFPDAQSDPPLYLNIAATEDTYGNFDAIHSGDIVDPRTIVEEDISDPVYGNLDAIHSGDIVDPRTIVEQDISDPVYGNFDAMTPSSGGANIVTPHSNIEEPLYGNIDAIENSGDQLYGNISDTGPVYGNF